MACQWTVTGLLTIFLVINQGCLSFSVMISLAWKIELWIHAWLLLCLAVGKDQELQMKKKWLFSVITVSCQDFVKSYSHLTINIALIAPSRVTFQLYWAESCGGSTIKKLIEQYLQKTNKQGVESDILYCSNRAIFLSTSWVDSWGITFIRWWGLELDTGQQCFLNTGYAALQHCSTVESQYISKL